MSNSILVEMMQELAYLFVNLLTCSYQPHHIDLDRNVWKMCHKSNPEFFLVN
jgi:hypothetical protein